jgi:hypothetical protein
MGIMAWLSADPRFPRPPFVLALAFAVLLGGIAASERVRDLAVGDPTPNLVASVLPGAVISLTNEERGEEGLGSLKASALLNQAAQLKANDMAAKSYYAHVSPDGTIPPAWLNKVGYKYQIMGENLVIDRTSSEQVVSAWMGSEAHRENILNPQFTEIGIGIAYGRYKEQDTTYVVQMLARPLGGSAPAPVKTVTVKPSKPLTTTRPLVPTPVPTKTAATTSVLVRPTPKPVVRDTLKPVLETVASSTLSVVPSIVADVTVTPVPVIEPYSSQPIELSPPAPVVPQRTSVGTKLRMFMGEVGHEVRSFFSPIF